MMLPNYLEVLKNDKDNKIKLKEYYFQCINEAGAELKKPQNQELYNWIRFRIRDHLSFEKSLDYSYAGLIYRMLSFEPFSSMLVVDLNNGITDSRTTRNIGLFIKLLVKFEKLNNIVVITRNNFDKMTTRLFNTYFKFLEDGGINEYEDESEYAPSGCVSFLTIHQSKGLEFPIVVVGSQSSVPRKQYDEDIENIITSYSGRENFEPLDDIKMFDFWRLFYVAFSRAQSLLVMMCDKSKKNEPSGYFRDLYNELPYDTDLSKFKFEKIKVGKLKPSYSFTADINAYDICPTQYMYFKELGFDPVRNGSTLFGTIVHQTIEDIHKNVLKGDISSITPDNIEKWLNINYKTISKATNSYLGEAPLKAALEQVNNYVERVNGNWEQIKNSEMPISLSTKNYIITGKIDLVQSKGGKYQLLDFKTEKKPDVNKDIELINKVRSQLEIYSYLFEKRYGIKVDSMKVYYTGEKNGNPYVTFRKNDAHIKETLKKFDGIVKDIDSKNYKKKCGDLKICRNCDLRFYCKRGN